MSRLALLAVGIAVLSACAQGIDRDDAIAALVLEGAGVVEATCIADTLLVVDRLDIAASGDDLLNSERELLLTASTRCHTSDADLPTSVLGASQRAEIEDPESALAFDDPDDSAAVVGGVIASAATGNDEAAAEALAVLRSAGIARLELIGRSHASAVCVVDYLIAAGAADIVAEPDFGVGRWPTEADAFAACL